MYTAEGYGTDLVPPPDWPYKTWLALIHTGDNHGPPTPGRGQKLLDQAKRELPGVKIRMGRLSDFGDAILAEEKARPSSRSFAQDMPDTWIHGIMSMPRQARWPVRHARYGGLGSLDTASGVMGRQTRLSACDRRRRWSSPTDKAGRPSRLPPPTRAAFSTANTPGGPVRAYYSPRLYGEAWKKAHAAGKYKYAEESWREHAAYIEDASKRVKDPLAERMASLPVRSTSAGRALSYTTRSLGVATRSLPWTYRERSAKSWADATTSASKSTRARVVAGGLWVRDLPPLGYVVLARCESEDRVERQAGSSERVIETQFFHAEIDQKRGMVTSLVDKRRGKELLDKSSEFGLGEPLYERYDKNNHLRFWRTTARSRCPVGRRSSAEPICRRPPKRNTQVREAKRRAPTCCVSRTGRSRFIPVGRFCPTVCIRMGFFTMLFRESVPYIDIVYAVLYKAPDPWPEALWLPLPFAIDEPKYQLGRLGSIIDPANDILP